VSEQVVYPPEDCLAAIMPVKDFQRINYCENIIDSVRICQNVFYWRSKTLLFKPIESFFKFTILYSLKTDIK